MTKTAEKIRSVYQCELTALTPLHTGSGDTYLRNFDFLFENKRVQVFDRNKLFHLVEDMGEKAINSYTAAIENETIPQWLKENSVKIKDILIHSFAADRPPREIRIQQKNGHGRPYIPGSSLKGALRTAILSKLSADEQRNSVKNSSRRLQTEDTKINLKFADQNICNRLLGRDAKQNFMRSLTTRDFYFSHNTVAIQQVWVARLTNQYNFSGKFPIYIEQINSSAHSEGQISLDDYLSHEATEGKAKDYFNFPFHFTLNSLLAAVREQSKKTIESELAFLERKTGKSISRLRHFYQKLHDQLGGLAKDEAILQLGWGSGWRGMTGQLLEPEELTGSLRKKLRLAPQSRYLDFPFPKSRRITAVNNDTTPMGWVRLKFTGKEDARKGPPGPKFPSPDPGIIREEKMERFRSMITSTQNLPGEIDSFLEQIKMQEDKTLQKELCQVLLEKARSLPKKKKFAKALDDGKNWANRLKSLCEDIGIQI